MALSQSNGAIRLILKNSFPLAIAIAFVLAFVAGGVVRDGMFMGFMSTLAIWFLIAKFPDKLKRLMGKYLLISDLILSTVLFGTFTAFIGPGPTVLMASATQAMLLSVLLAGLKINYYEPRTFIP